MEPSRDELAKHLKDDLLTLYSIIVEEVYTPTQFRTKLLKQGAIDCTADLISKKGLSYGFQKLYLGKRLELTLENFIINSPIYHNLFKPSMLNNAKQKLTELEFDFNGSKLNSFAKKHPQYKFHYLELSED